MDSSVELTSLADSWLAQDAADAAIAQEAIAIAKRRVQREVGIEEDMAGSVPFCEV